MGYYDIAFTETVKARQEGEGSRESYARAAEKRAGKETLSAAEIEFLALRDSVYIASVSEDGWPYVQHRGGDPGFLAALDPSTVVWAERKGNRQFITAGNLDAGGKLSLITVDYPNRRRLKLFGTATHDPEPSSEELARLGVDREVIDGVVRLSVVGYDWNCPKYITPRYTESQVRDVVSVMEKRISELEEQLALS